MSWRNGASAGLSTSCPRSWCGGCETQDRRLEGGEVYEQIRQGVADRSVDPYTAADELLEKLGL